MSDLQKCCKCKSEQLLKYFSNNKKGQLYKTCDKCRNKRKGVTCNNINIADTIELLKKATANLEQVLKEDAESSSTDVDTHDNKSTTAETNSITDEKYVIVMDVETNGLIKHWSATPSKHNLHLFPNIVQMSWGLYHENGECKAMKNYIIKPNDWHMHESEKFHGISLEKASQEGIDIKTVLTEYKNDIENYCIKLVCHNIDFDRKVVLSELIRHDMDIKDIDEYCTMKNSINYCKLKCKKKKGYKLPSLAELYRTCYNEELENPHNAYYDVINCAKCYFHINSK